MAGPADVTDLNDRSLRTLTNQEKSVGAVLLEDAFTVITARVPSVADRLAATPADTAFNALVVQIQCAMVLRVLNNPDGKLEEQSDDYRYRLDAAVSTGALYLSDAEANLLSAGDGASDGAFTIRPAGQRRENGWWVTPDMWEPSL